MKHSPDIMAFQPTLTDIAALIALPASVLLLGIGICLIVDARRIKRLRAKFGKHIHIKRP